MVITRENLYYFYSYRYSTYIATYTCIYSLQAIYIAIILEHEKTLQDIQHAHTYTHTLAIQTYKLLSQHNTADPVLTQNVLRMQYSLKCMPRHCATQYIFYRMPLATSKGSVLSGFRC